MQLAGDRRLEHFEVVDVVAADHHRVGFGMRLEHLAIVGIEAHSRTVFQKAARLFQPGGVEIRNRDHLHCVHPPPRAAQIGRHVGVGGSGDHDSDFIHRKASLIMV